MSEHEIGRQIDTNEVSRYQAVFEKFYDDQRAVLDAIGMVYFDPRQDTWKKDLNDAVAQIQRSFKKCISEILESSKDANEFSLDVTEFMVENERIRLQTALAMITSEEFAYQTYNKVDLYDSISRIHNNVVDIRIMIEKITILFSNGLHGDLNAMLADIAEQKPRTG